MPPKGHRKRKSGVPGPGSPEERAILHSKVGLDEDAKAILLAQALAAIRDGLASPSNDHRLRAASMALSILGAKPSRNPMAAPSAPPKPTPRPTPTWMPGAGASSGVARTARAQGADDLGLEPF